MKNNKGFAISGILYGILILFLFLLLLILGNLQARKVLFDKQKAEILDKLEEIISVDEKSELDKVYTSTSSEYFVAKDGNYSITACGSSVCQEGNYNFFQGMKLYIVAGDTSSVSLERFGSLLLSNLSSPSDSLSPSEICSNNQVCINYLD